MTILEIKKYFNTTLLGRYTESEIAFLCKIGIEKIVGLDAHLQRRFYHQTLLLDDQEKLIELANQLKTPLPYQYILKETSFYNYDFYVNPAVLIPRPETEELVEIAIDTLKNSDNEGNRSLLEIGTGSGVISIILKKKLAHLAITSIDISANALEVARINAKKLNTEITFLEADYLSLKLKDQYDVLISNPPYIDLLEIEEIEDSVKNFEPKVALFSPTKDPLVFYKKIANDAATNLNKGGYLFLEINQKLGEETLELFKKDFSSVRLLKDLSGNDRFIMGKK